MRGRPSGDGWLLEAVANREGLSQFCCLDRVKKTSKIFREKFVA